LNIRLWLLRIFGISGILFTAAAVYYFRSHDISQLAYSLSDAVDTDLYSISGNFADQNGRVLQLKEFRGQVSIAGFVYLNCRSVCPQIVRNMDFLRQKLETQRPGKKVRLLLFLFDREKPDAASSSAFFIRHRIDRTRWDLLWTNPETLKTLTDVFSLEYSVIDETSRSYMHTNLIFVVDADGFTAGSSYGLKDMEDLSGTALRALQSAPDL